VPTALTTPTGAVTIDQLLARAEINDVLQRYVRGIDRVDMEVVSSCYHPGAYDDHGQFQGTVEEFTEWLSGRLGRHEATTHFLSTPLIRFTGDDIAQVDTYCINYAVAKPHEDGTAMVTTAELRYLDRFERRDGRWLIAHRRAVHDWRYHETTANLLDTATLAGFIGRRDRGDACYEDVPPYPAPSAQR
jgi:hypothetical protein